MNWLYHRSTFVPHEEDIAYNASRFVYHDEPMLVVPVKNLNRRRRYRNLVPVNHISIPKADKLMVWKPVADGDLLNSIAIFYNRPRFGYHAIHSHNA